MDAATESFDSFKKMRWDGGPTTHYEVWYTTLNHATSGAGFWIRYLLLVAPGRAPQPQVWFTSFLPGTGEHNIAVARRYPAGQFAAESAPFRIQMGPCWLGSARMAGMLDAGGIPVVWDLVYEAVTDPLTFLPDAFYQTGWVRSKLLTPHPFLQIGGKIQIGERSFILNGDPGQQGHVWGSRHASEWLW